MTTTDSFHITDNAARRINELLSAQNLPSGALRVAVEGGGCSGFQYKFALESSPAGEHDIVIRKDGAQVIVDDISLQMLTGAEIDFVETLSGASFEIKNPNSTASCGCGNSFSVF